MTPDKARRVVVAYLVGKRVSAEEVALAVAVVGQDDAYVSFLQDQFRGRSVPVSECDRFRVRAAEFSEASAEVRRLEMPELLSHLGECLACLNLLWELQPVWVSNSDSLAVAGRLLSEPIEIAWRPEGLKPCGLGPVPEVPEAVFSTALDAPGTEHIEEEAGHGLPEPVQRWRLEDAAMGFNVTLELRHRAQNRVSLRCGIGRLTMRVEETRQAVAGPVWIEVFREQALDMPAAKGPLNSFAAEGILLSPGDWMIRLSASEPGANWQIPLRILSEKPS